MSTLMAISVAYCGLICSVWSSDQVAFSLYLILERFYQSINPRQQYPRCRFRQGFYRVVEAGHPN